MKIKLSDKLLLIIKVYCNVLRMPLRVIRFIIFSPVDVTRYLEIPFLCNFMKERMMTGLQILDVSSPFIAAYILSRDNFVTKTDIDLRESKYIKEDARLRFCREDATRLSFADGSFDIVYSISVIEHIYGNYRSAIAEMLRVTRPGGYVYLSFPVALQHVEEWSDDAVYSDQFRQANRVFFQYRFDQADVQGIVADLAQATVVSQAIYWERSAGTYDKAMTILRYDWGKGPNLLKSALVNLYYGLTMIDGEAKDFNDGQGFGNMSLLLQKL